MARDYSCPKCGNNSTLLVYDLPLSELFESDEPVELICNNCHTITKLKQDNNILG